jgi:g-D-glutamyl-meso-diaminopimelate peptidase
MKNKFIAAAVALALCAAVSTGAVLVKRHRYSRLMSEVAAAVSADAAAGDVQNPTDDYPLFVVTGNDFVPMQRTASDDAEEINKVYPGSIVEFMGDAADGYAYIRGKGSSIAGYVKKEFLKKSDFVYSLSELNIVDTDSSMYSYEEMENDIKQLAETYECLTYSSIGQSADGRELYKLSIGSGEKKMLLYGAMYGTDYTASQLLMKQAEYYAHYINSGIYEGYLYSDLFSNVSIDIIPMANPDGVCINQWGADILLDDTLKQSVKDTFYSDRSYGYTTEVKTVYYSTWKSNANGVDLTRSFPVGFDNAPTLKGSSYTGYKGSEPLAESETKALADLIDNCGYGAVIGLKAEGSCVTYIGDSDSNAVRSVMRDFAKDISEMSNYPLNKDCSSYSCGGSLLLYAADKNIPSVEIGISGSKAPLKADDLQEPWIKLRELPAFIAKMML